MGIGAIIFDLYETLITEFDPDPDWKPERLSIAELLGMSEEAFARGWRRVNDARMRGVVDFPDALRAICRFAGVALPDPDLSELLVKKRAATKASPFRAVHPEVGSMLAELQKMGVGLCLMTNASSEETQAWPTSELAAYFDAVVVSSDVGFLKPEREIYDHGCALLGKPAEEVAFVGDGGADELVGAQSAGLAPYWATWFLDHWPAGVRHRYAARAKGFPRLLRLSDVVDILDRDVLP